MRLFSLGCSRALKKKGLRLQAIGLSILHNGCSRALKKNGLRPSRALGFSSRIWLQPSPEEKGIKTPARGFTGIRRSGCSRALKKKGLRPPRMCPERRSRWLQPSPEEKGIKTLAIAHTPVFQGCSRALKKKGLRRRIRAAYLSTLAAAEP